MIGDPVEALQLFSQVRLGIALQMDDDRLIIAIEVLNKPIVNARYDESITRYSDATGVIDIVPRPFIQQCISIPCRKSLKLEVGATDGCTVYSVVNPWIFPDRAQNAVLNII